MIRKLIPFVALITVGCTQSQINAWLSWYESDPDSATEFAQRPEVQSQLLGNSDGPQFEEWLGSYQPGDCDSYVPLFEHYGLPVATFKRIAWRESGCNHRSFVSDHDDLGGGLLGLNLRAGARGWFEWCGLTTGNVTDASKNVECASEAYQRLGLQPWG